ncbi:MAG: OmpA family protein [Acidimicrobiia bacterium]
MATTSWGGSESRYYVRDPRGRKAAAWVAGLGFPVIYLGMNLWNSGSGVQNRLTKATEERLADAGVPADRYSVRYRGQIAYITDKGLTASQVEIAKDVYHQAGVQDVVIENGDAPPPAAAVAVPAATTTAAPATTAAPTTVAPTTAAPTTAAPTTAAPKPVNDLKATLGADGKIVLTGTVLSAAEKAAVVQAAVEAFGAERVVDQLKVQAPEAATAASDGAVRKVAELIGLMKVDFVTGEIALKDTALSITGVAPGDPAKTAFTTAANGATANGLTPTVNITVAAPAQAAEDLRKKLADNLAISGIEFATNSADITPESTAILDRAAQYILATPDSISVEVGGHTDNIGSASANLALSQRRADAVRTYLIGKGVNPARLTAVGFGLTQPIADNSTEAGRQQNRRIQFTVGG